MDNQDRQDREFTHDQVYRDSLILAPVPKNVDWRDFVYLAAAPAAAKANGGGPAVIAVDEYGTVRPWLANFLDRCRQPISQKPTKLVGFCIADGAGWLYGICSYR